MFRILLVIVLLCISCASAAAEDKVAVEQLEKSAASWNGTSLPDFGTDETEVTVLKITVAPGTRLPVHIHPVINVAYMLSGELTVVSSTGEKKTIRGGDALIELVDQKHYGINESDDPAELVVVYFGRQGQPVTVKE